MTTSSKPAEAEARLAAHAAVHHLLEDALYGVLERLVALDVDGAPTPLAPPRGGPEGHKGGGEEAVLPLYAPIAPKDGPGRLDHVAGDHTILLRNCDIATHAIDTLD